MPKVNKITPSEIASIAKLADEHEDIVRFITARIRSHGAEAAASMEEIRAILRFGNSLTDLASVLLYDLDLHAKREQLEQMRASVRPT